VLVPIDGPVRQGVGLLGSPSFEIPRTVARDNKFEHLAKGYGLRRRLAAKNRHNLVTIGLHLLSRWMYFFVIMVITAGVVDLRTAFGGWAVPLAPALLVLPFTFAHAVVVERAATGFKGLKPTYCSIYQRDFWRVERFFKNTSDVQILLNGTPFKSIIWRLLGAQVGKRVFDDGLGMGERNMVTIGDEATFNAGCNLQCHTQEDYAFKSDFITVGSGCTIGVGAMVYYGVTMGDGAILAPDSFLMKGEEVPPHAHWGGNPATEMPYHSVMMPAPPQVSAMSEPSRAVLAGRK
jgi:non-ribosomal peptide synthetase-like protein